MRRLLLSVLVVVAVLAIAAALLIPARASAPVAATFDLTWPVVRGAFHVHSRRSDGTGSVEEIAAAAAAAGLQFVILTDHGDGTRPSDPPAYHSGVLCIDGVEISTDGGHYAVVGLDRSPYPLAGDPHDVIDDVRRFGGYGIVAHPGSPKPGLRWQAWEAPFDGLEWLNADSEWRDELWHSLGRALLTYPFRPVETLGLLIDRPAEVLQQWDRLTGSRRVPALAGADAHARLGFGQAREPYDDRVLARVPGYAVSFRAFANHVILDRAPSGDAAQDAALILDSIREGRVFTSVDALAGLTAFEARATSGDQLARPGEYLDAASPVAIEARIAAPDRTTLVVLRDGEPLYETHESALRIDVGLQPGAYRVEARLDGRSGAAPWILSNPIYIGMRERHGRATGAPAPSVATVRTGIATEAWRAEASPGSVSVLRRVALDDGTPALEWQFALAAGPPQGQYAALRFPADQNLATHNRLQLRARGDQPRRLWAQLRAPGAGQGERWGRTFRVETELAPIELRFADFGALGDTTAAPPPLARVDSLLLVIDTLNTRPGASGRIWIPDLWLAR